MEINSSLWVELLSNWVKLIKNGFVLFSLIGHSQYTQDLPASTYSLFKGQHVKHNHVAETVHQHWALPWAQFVCIHRKPIRQAHEAR